MIYYRFLRFLLTVAILQTCTTNIDQFIHLIVLYINMYAIMNNIMNVHKLSINLDINRYIEYILMYIGYECVGYKCVGYIFIYTLMYSCIKPYK